MGVYINIEIPKKFDQDNYIELARGIDGKNYARVYNYHFCGLTEWCEIVPVPPHGRLIDADALKKYLEDNWIPANFDVIDNAPTVIPAEPSKEE